MKYSEPLSTSCGRDTHVAIEPFAASAGYGPMFNHLMFLFNKPVQALQQCFKAGKENMAKFLKTDWFIPLLNPHVALEVYIYHAQVWGRSSGETLSFLNLWMIYCSHLPGTWY